MDRTNLYALCMQQHRSNVLSVARPKLASLAYTELLVAVHADLDQTDLPPLMNATDAGLSGCPR